LTPALASDCRSTACTIWSSHNGPALTIGPFCSARSCAESGDRAGCGPTNA
jgi:hypothetical protein